MKRLDKISKVRQLKKDASLIFISIKCNTFNNLYKFAFNFNISVEELKIALLLYKTLDMRQCSC